MNEGGLFGEREGWHLPGFDTSSWTERDLSEGLPSGGAGVGFFVTTFECSSTSTRIRIQFRATNIEITKLSNIHKHKLLVSSSLFSDHRQS